ncbi:MAG: hypothetical protein R3D03_14450 [Geminicoccaceae bacterium]
MIRRTFLASTAAAGLGAATTRRAAAQEVTLRLHQLLSLQAIIPGKAPVPWAHKVETEVGRRIKVEHYPRCSSAALRHLSTIRPGMASSIWSGRCWATIRDVFRERGGLRTAVHGHECSDLEGLPRLLRKVPAGRSVDIKPIALHVHGPGTLHMKGPPVARLEDLRGRKVRGPTRIITTCSNGWAPFPSAWCRPCPKPSPRA